jgi:hypothetical protein
MDLLVIALLGVTLAICLGEAYYERDFPRDTIKYFLLVLVVAALWFRAI